MIKLTNAFKKKSGPADNGPIEDILSAARSSGLMDVNTTKPRLLITQLGNPKVYKDDDDKDVRLKKQYNHVVETLEKYVADQASQTRPAIVQTRTEANQLLNIISQEFDRRSITIIPNAPLSNALAAQNVKRFLLKGEEKAQRTEEVLLELKDLRAKVDPEDVFGTVGYKIPQQVKAAANEWLKAVGTPNEDLSNPFLVHKAEFEAAFKDLGSNLEKIIAAQADLALSDAEQAQVATTIQAIERDLGTAAAVSDTTGPNPEQQRYLHRVASDVVSVWDGGLSSKVLQSVIYREGFTGGAGNVLGLLGLTPQQVVLLSEGNTSNIDTHTVRSRLKRIEELMTLGLGHTKAEDIAKLRAMFADIQKSSSTDAGLMSSLIEQAKKDKETLLVQVKAFMGEVDRAFIYAKDEKGDVKKDSNGHPIVAEKPESAFLLGGANGDNSVVKIREDTIRQIDKRKEFWGEQIVNAFIEQNNFLEDAVTKQDWLDKFRLLSEITSVVDPDALAKRFDEIDHELSTIQDKKEREDTLLQRVNDGSLFREIKVADVDLAGIDTTGLSPNAIKMIQILSVSRDKIRGGSDEIHATLLPNESEQTRKQHHESRQIHTAEAYLAWEKVRAGSFINKGINDISREAREKVEKSYRAATTGLTRAWMEVKSRILYPLNTLLGFIPYFANRGLYGTAAITLGASAISIFAAPAVAPALLAWGLISVYGYFATKQPLRIAVKIAAEGIEFQIKKQNMYINALREVYKAGVETPELLMQLFFVISDFMLENYERGNPRRKEDIKFYYLRLLSCFGVTELGGAQNMRRDDMTKKDDYVDITTCIIQGWYVIPKERRGNIERTIKTAGYRGQYGEAAWKSFTAEYGTPDSDIVRINGPFPQARSKFLKWFYTSTSASAEQAGYQDIAIEEANHFGAGARRFFGQVMATQVKPDLTAWTSSVENLKKQVMEFLPTKLGGVGRQRQLVQKDPINFFGNLLASL